MAAGRCALIVAVDRYQDGRLGKLRSPARDAAELQRVLANPSIGEFEVQVSANEEEHLVRRRIASFFATRHRDDLLLLHMACHGLKDDFGQLYFAATDTDVAQLDATAVPAEFVNRQMTHSRSHRIVLLLDCCYSGAFARGMISRGGNGVGVSERFEGSGRAVITASNAMEYSFEDGEVSGYGTPSVFTTAIVEGLETGDADADGDDWISVDELYDYVYERVREATPKQTPGKWVFDVRGDLLIARSVRVPEPASELAEGSAHGDRRAEAPTPPQPPARGRPPRWSRGRSAAVAGLATLAATVIAGVALLQPGEREPVPREGAGARPSPDRPSVTTSAVGDRPFGLAEAGGRIWVASVSDGTVTLLDAGTGDPVGRLTLGGGPHGVAAGAGGVWVTGSRSATVTRIDPGTRDAGTPISVGRRPIAIAIGLGAIWTANAQDRTVSRIDAATPERGARHFRVGGSPRGIATTDDAVWVSHGGSVSELDPRTGALRQTFPVGPRAYGLWVASGRLWVANHGGDSVSRIDLVTRRLLMPAIRVGDGPRWLASGAGAVWVVNSGDDTVWRLDPDTGRRLGRPVPVGKEPVAIRFAAGSAWVANNDSDTVSRLVP